MGAALGDLLHGLPINAAHNYTGNFFGPAHPVRPVHRGDHARAVPLMGATYLALKTTGELHAAVGPLTRQIGWVAVVVWGFVTWTHLGLGKGFVPNPLEALAVAGRDRRGLARRRPSSEGWAFAAAGVGMAATVGDDLRRALPAGDGVDHQRRLQPDGGQLVQPGLHAQVMTVVAVIFFPVVLLYQGWSYHIFRGRIAAPKPATVGDGPAVTDGAPATPVAPAAAPAVITHESGDSGT